MFFINGSIARHGMVCQAFLRYTCLSFVIFIVAGAIRPGAAGDLPRFYSLESGPRTFGLNTVETQEAAFDLGAAGLSFRVVLPGGSVGAADGLDRAFDLPQSLIAFGAPAPPVAGKAPDDWSCSPPAGPILSDGRWLLTPEGRWSAMGLGADGHAVFATSWLPDGGSLQDVELELGAEETCSIAAINRLPNAGEMTLLTPEFSPTRRFQSLWSDAMIVVLAPHDEKTAGRARYLVYKIPAADSRIALQDGLLLLCARGRAGEWLRSRVRRNDIVTLRTQSPPEWEFAQQAIPLGAPLIWEGRPVSLERLDPDAREAWGDWQAPAPAVIASVPSINQLRVMWTGSVAGNQPPADRQGVVEYLLDQGACYAFELFAPEGRPLLYSRDQWVGWRATGARPPDAVCAIEIAAKAEPGPADAEEWVNLCLAAPPSLQTNRTEPDWNPPLAAIDGRYGEDPALDSFWEGEPNPRESISWLELKWSAPQAVGKIEIRHAGAVGFSPQFNTSGFRILGRASTGSAWEKLDEQNQNWAGTTVVEFPRPLVISAIRIEIVKPNHFENNPRARLAEVSVWGPASGSPRN